MANVTKAEAQAAAEQIAATVADTRDPNGHDRADQLAAVRELQRLIDQTPEQ